MMLATVIGGVVSYKNFPPRRWGEFMWVITTLLWGMVIGMVISLLTRDYWFDIYNVVNPYVNK